MSEMYIWLCAVLLLVGPVFVVGKLTPAMQWRTRLIAALALIALVWIFGDDGTMSLKLIMTLVALGVIWERYRAYRGGLKE